VSAHFSISLQFSGTTAYCHAHEDLPLQAEGGCRSVQGVE
jgi:hypothetical protein